MKKINTWFYVIGFLTTRNFKLKLLWQRQPPAIINLSSCKTRLALFITTISPAVRQRQVAHLCRNWRHQTNTYTPPVIHPSPIIHIWAGSNIFLNFSYFSIRTLFFSLSQRLNVKYPMYTHTPINVLPFDIRTMVKPLRIL